MNVFITLQRSILQSGLNLFFFFFSFLFFFFCFSPFYLFSKASPFCLYHHHHPAPPLPPSKSFWGVYSVKCIHPLQYNFTHLFTLLCIIPSGGFTAIRPLIIIFPHLVFLFFKEQRISTHPRLPNLVSAPARFRPFRVCFICNRYISICHLKKAKLISNIVLAICQQVCGLHAVIL